MGVEKKAKAPDESDSDPNFIAFQRAESLGQFSNLDPGTYVAFHEGKLVGTEADKKKLFQLLGEKGIPGFFYRQVGVPVRVRRL